MKLDRMLWLNDYGGCFLNPLVHIWPRQICHTGFGRMPFNIRATSTTCCRLEAYPNTSHHMRNCMIKYLICQRSKYLAVRDIGMFLMKNASTVVRLCAADCIEDPRYRAMRPGETFIRGHCGDPRCILGEGHLGPHDYGDVRCSKPASLHKKFLSVSCQSLDHTEHV